MTGAGPAGAATVKSLLDEARRGLDGVSATSRLDAEVLLCHAAGISRTDCLAHGDRVVDAEGVERYRRAVGRRRAREPVAYIIGRREFFGLEFEVTADVLIPRPETELLVETAVSWARRGRGRQRILDLGTGSGCVAVALAVELRRLGVGAEITASDREGAALNVAARNVSRHGVEDAVRLVESDWFAALGEDRFDIIVSNPPYVPERGAVLPPELGFEPASALFGGDDGMREIRKLLRDAPARMAASGAFLCEIGFGQAEALRREFGAALVFYRDLAGVERVLQCVGSPA